MYLFAIFFNIPFLFITNKINIIIKKKKRN